MKNELLLQSKNDIPFIEAQVQIHQPTINEISLINEENFQIGCRFLNFSKDILSEEDKSNLTDKTDFEIFMSILCAKESYSLRTSVKFVLTLLFPEYEVIFNDDFIELKKEDFSSQINNTNYESFRDILVSMFRLEDEASRDKYNPIDKRAEKIAEKLRKAKEKTRPQNEDDGKKGISIFAKYVSILAVGLQKDKNILMEYTVTQLKDEFDRYQKKINWDYYIEAKKAGAQDLDEVDNWMI